MCNENRECCGCGDDSCDCASKENQTCDRCSPCNGPDVSYTEIQLDLEPDVLLYLETTAKENKCTVDEVVEAILHRYVEEYDAREREDLR